MLELFKNPNVFFRNKMNEPEDLKKPFYIMVLVWFARLFMVAVTLLMVANIISSNSSLAFPDIPSEMILFFLFLTAAVLIITFISILLMWLVTACVFYLFSAVFHGTGSFKRVLEFISYGFIPFLIGSIIAPIYLWLIYSKIDFIALFENMEQAGDPTLIMNEILFSNLPAHVLSLIIALILFALTLYIWIYGIKYSRNLSFKQAVLTIGIPAIAYIIYELIMFVFLYF
jgi:hypothetical protein